MSDDSHDPAGRGAAPRGDLPEDAAEPTTLILAWPGSGAPDEPPPSRGEVLLALARGLGRELAVVQDLGPDAGGGARLHWGSVIRRDDGPPPREAIIWCEPARPNAPEELEATGGRPFRHVVGVETLLDEARPLEDFADVLALALDAVPDAAALLDANTGTWSSRDEIEAMLDASGAVPLDERDTDGVRTIEGLDLPPEILWAVHAVGRPDPEAPLWLHTHGLARTGRPELELLEVPGHLGGAAARLLHLVAGRLLESGPVAAGATVEVGPGEAVTLQDWRIVVPFVPEGVPGGAGDRTGELAEGHAGRRFVVCGPEPEGAYRPVWTTPRRVLERLDRGDLPLYLSRAEVRHRRRIARVRWAEAATAHASLRGERRTQVSLAVKCPFGGGGGAPVEHLWFEVKAVDGDRIDAVLASPPHGDVGLAEGDAARIEAAAIEDWTFLTPHGRFGPDDVAGLWRSVDLLREPPGSTA